MHPRVTSFVLLVVIVLGGLFAMDVVAAPDVSASGERDPAADISAHAKPLHAGTNRAFVLFGDSLRYETAPDPAMMPRLGALRARGTPARVMSTRDPIPIPAIRAAFTGRAR